MAMSNAEKVRRHRERKRRAEGGRTISVDLSGYPPEAFEGLRFVMDYHQLTMGEAIEYMILVIDRERRRVGAEEFDRRWGTFEELKAEFEQRHGVKFDSDCIKIEKA